MIWSIVSKEEMSSFGTTPVFGVYEEALGRENIKLAVVDEDDRLDFLQSEDIALLRTASKSIIESIKKKGVRTTAEYFDVYDSLYDKRKVSRVLDIHGIKVPHEYTLDEISDVNTYFVKSRFGSDSIGISSENVCKSKRDVNLVCRKFSSKNQYPLIEDFLEGNEYTVACVRQGDSMEQAAIKVECNTKYGIQTFDSKLNINEYCSPILGSLKLELECISLKVCEIFKVKHMCRVDFRKDRFGNLYVIDVNALPGLGMKAHLSKCFLLQKNYSYIDTMKMVVESATYI